MPVEAQMVTDGFRDKSTWESGSLPLAAPLHMRVLLCCGMYYCVSGVKSVINVCLCVLMFS